MSILTLLGLGFLLGIEHATDADHVAAISTMTSDSKNLKNSAMHGIYWGLGHTFTLLLVGLLLLLFKITIPQKLAVSFEFIVGLMLVFLGINLFVKILKSRFHLHLHKHGKIKHLHYHTHKSQHSHRHSRASFFVGLVHGLAGSAALMLLVLATVKSIASGLIYIMVFGVGSILGMLLISISISIPILLAKNLSRIHFIIRSIASFASIIIGISIIVSILGI
ncbi:sulfite exporter TauE/SafE family protein [Candidatus Woesearchaeota archaeon]|nr:sulfite exporter TauE/SafE family protein [Candidatus Woesearchaeota archaeon]